MPYKLTKKKAKKILSHGSVRGKKLTGKQKRFMGAKAGGSKMRKK
jgi:hypothetical protein